MRLCKVCKKEKRLDEFPRARLTDGKVYKRHICTKCYSQVKSKRRKRISAEFLEFKKTLACEGCGISDHRVLEFHHIDPDEKDGNVSSMAHRGFPMTTVMKEIAKCKVLCANCHRILHFDEDNGM